MDTKTREDLRKYARIAGVTAVTAGAAVLLVGKEAVKAAVEGYRYVKERAGEILADPQVVEEAPAAEPVSQEAAPQEAPEEA